MPRITVTVKDVANHSAQSTVDYAVTTVDPGTPTGLTAPDGGSDPYKGKMPSDPNFLPIGVWFESVLSQADVDKDKDAGLNLYVELTDNSLVNLIRSNGMYAIHGHTNWAVGTETPGWLINDELDMRAGPGWGAWNGGWGWPMCSPDESVKCGYTITKNQVDDLPKDGRLRYANYGKGVTFWESDTEAGIFVNGGTAPGSNTFTKFQDVVSVDNYWFTDANIRGQWEGASLVNGSARQLTLDETRRPVNYALTEEKLRSLVRPLGSMATWAFVEVGGPFTENTTLASYIKPREVQAAVWHSFIGGARGLIYFNHSFGGPNQSQHALRESAYAAVRAAVKTTNGQLKNLAHVINGSFAAFPTGPTGVVKASLRYSHTANKYYILAGHAGNRNAAATTAQFTVPVQSGTVTVEFENRTIPIVNGKFSDSFADSLTTHVYRIN